jgi:hypothetical protein
MHKPVSRSSFCGVALLLAVVVTGCSKSSSSTAENTETKTAATEISVDEACSRVDAAFEDSRKYDARYENKAATVDEVIAAYKTAADAFSATAEQLGSQHLGVFRAVALVFNQYRVSLETGETMDEFALEDGKDAVGEYMKLCNKSWDFEST